MYKEDHRLWYNTYTPLPYSYDDRETVWGGGAKKKFEKFSTFAGCLSRFEAKFSSITIA